MFLVMSVPRVSFILIVSCLNQQLMHLFHTSPVPVAARSKA